MNDIEYKNTLYEVNEILKTLDTSLVDKVPKYIIDEIKENMSKNYYFKFDPAKKLEEQKLLPTTEQFLTVLYLKYICTEDEKKDILKKMED